MGSDQILAGYLLAETARTWSHSLKKTAGCLHYMGRSRLVSTPA